VARGRYAREYGEQRDFKKRIRRNKRRRRITLFIFICIIFFGTIYLLPVFKISSKSISIIGVDKTATEVGNYASTLVGKNINWYSMDGMQQTLLSMPYVKDATVSRHFPNRLKIEIIEAQGVLQAKHGDVSFLIDDRGKVIDSYGDYGAIAGLIGVDEDFAVGGFISEQDKLTNLTSVIGEIEKADILAQMTSLDLTDDSNIQFALGGLNIQLGDSSKMDYKFQMLANVREQLLPNIKGDLDLRNGSKAYFKEIYD